MRAAIRASLACVLVSVAPVARADELARGRPYEWNRAPSYTPCTDAADAMQLTDGLRATNDFSWLDRAAVGWELQKGDIVTLTLDLGKSAPLDSIIVQTAWFARSEIVPPSLLCAVANAPNQFEWAGALDAATLVRPDSTRPARVALAVPLGARRGRWVLIAALLRSNFLCTDEVQVYGGGARASVPAPQESVAAAPFSGVPSPAGRPAAPAPVPLGRAFTPDEIDSVCALQRRLWALRQALPGPVSLPATGPAAHESPGQRRDLGHPAVVEEAARLAARARSWRAAGLPALVVRRVDPWTPTTPWSALQVERADTLELWPGAWGAAAIEIASSADSTVHAALRVAPAEGPRLTLREVVHVESRDGSWAGDALPLAPASLALAPGTVRQVWIDVEARNAAPGMHDLQIEVAGRTIPLAVRVHALRLPAAALAALDWNYPTKFALTRPLLAEAMQDNREHGIDSWCLAEESAPWPDPAAIDASGHIASPLDFTACDRALATLGPTSAHRIVWYWDFDPRAEDPSRGRFRHSYLSPAWRRAVSEWLEAWRTHLEALGLDPRRILMQPVDETSSPAVLQLYRTLRELHPGLPLALTLTRNATPDELRALAPHLALAIVERSVLAQRSKWIARVKRRGIEVWTYAVPFPSKSAPPLAAYRTLPWEAWARGLSGCGFWAYGDTGGQSADAWNDFDAERSDFAVVYGEIGAPRPLRGEALAPSKRWQAFRMGMEDTALLATAVRRRPGLRATVIAALGCDPGLRPDGERLRWLRLVQ